MQLYFVLVHVITTLSVDLRQRRQQPEQTQPELSPLLLFLPLLYTADADGEKKKKKIIQGAEAHSRAV